MTAQPPYTVQPMAPIVAVIFPPTTSITIAVQIPEPLASDLRRRWQREDDADLKARFKRFTFDEWIIERLKDVQYGPGTDAGDVDDHGRGVRPLG